MLYSEFTIVGTGWLALVEPAVSEVAVVVAAPRPDKAVVFEGKADAARRHLLHVAEVGNLRGRGEAVSVALPHRPLLLSPHAHTVPSLFAASACCGLFAICVTVGVILTTFGSLLER